MGRMADPEEIGKSIAFIGKRDCLTCLDAFLNLGPPSERALYLYYGLAVDRRWRILVSSTLSQLI